MQTISGADPLDRSTEDRPVPDWLDGIERGPQGLRIGVPKQHFWENLEPDIERLVRKAIADLESAGASVREVEWPQIADYNRSFVAVMFAEASAYHAPNFPSRRADYGAQVASLLDIGLAITGVQYVEGLRFLQEQRRGAADAVLDGVDVLAVPSMPVAPPTIEASRNADPGARMAVFTSIFDLSGQPAISVPCGLTSAGLPASIMFAARRWDEASALRAARAYEQIRGEFPAPPV
jgi:Asp-tRNA(Asn)/Glu-tRNA(Gln) amidotransferase A subunit family amidase